MKGCYTTKKPSLVLDCGRLRRVNIDFIQVEIGIIGRFETVEDGATLEGDFTSIFSESRMGLEEADRHGEVEREGVAICPGSRDWVVGARGEGRTEGRTIEGEDRIWTPGREAEMYGECTCSPRG